MSMLPIQAPSIRTWATMFPPSSAHRDVHGLADSFAFFSAALITRRASSSFTADMLLPPQFGAVLRVSSQPEQYSA